MQGSFILLRPSDSTQQFYTNYCTNTIFLQPVGKFMSEDTPLRRQGARSPLDDSFFAGISITTTICCRSTLTYRYFSSFLEILG